MATNTTEAKVRAACGIDDTTILTSANVTQFMDWANRVAGADAQGAATADLELLETIYSAHLCWLHINSAATDNFSSESFNLSKNFHTQYLDEYNRLLPKLRNSTDSPDVTPLGERKLVPSSFVDQR